MPIVDLSYAAQSQQTEKPESGIVLGLSIKGWNCGWATAEQGHPVKCGWLKAQTKVEGEAVPVAHRSASMFRALLDLMAQDQIELVIQDFQKQATGPIWNLAPLLSVASNSKYTEVRKWMDTIGVNHKTLSAWATTALGKPPQHEVVSQAMGLAVVGSQQLMHMRGEAHK